MNTFSTYHSPIRILAELGLNPTDFNEENLKTERKRLLLEIQLSDSQTILIGDKTISKNDVINVFDEFKDTRSLAHHIRIFGNKQMLDLLENFDISNLQENEPQLKFNYESEEDKVDFKKFVSPYLANAFDKLLSKAIRDSSYDEFEKVLPFSTFLTAPDALHAFRKFYSYCEFLLERLEATEVVNSVFPFEQFHYLYSKSFYKIANQTSEYYHDFADMLAESVTDFIVEQQKNKSRSTYLRKISKQLCTLNLSVEGKFILSENHRLFRRQTLLQITPTFGIRWKWVRIFAILFLWFTLGGIFGDKTPRVNRKTLEQASIEERFSEIDRLTMALDQQISIQPFSYVRRTKFDTIAFRTFHDSVINCVQRRDFEINQFKTNNLPQVISPLIIPDSSFVIPFGRKAKLWNETDSELLLVIRDKNAISSYYIPAQDVIDLDIDPRSSMFFYAGNDWNGDQAIKYKHPYKSAMSDSIVIALNGSFNRISSMDLAFMSRVFFIRNGSSNHFAVKEVDGKYVLSDRSRIRQSTRY